MSESKKVGRPKGAVAKSTREVREAIAEFVGGNTQHFDKWLMQTAYGIAKVNEKGETVRDTDGSVAWVNRPDPYSALKAASDLAEYFIPKLSRQELSATIETITEENVALMSTDELKLHLMRSIADNSDVIDGELVEPINAIPDFLKAG